MVETMGTKIRDKRIALEMTLTTLAGKVGVGVSTVRKWETGYIKDMRSDKIQKVADALDVTPAYLMGWEDAPSQNLAPGVDEAGEAGLPALLGENGEPLSKEEAELLRIYKELGVRGRMRLLTAAMELEAEEAVK